MAEELKKYFHRLLKMVDGLNAIIISDRDGVPVLKVCGEGTPDLALRPKFLATFGMATEQASKLGLSANKTIVSIYDNHQVICLNKLPLIITMIASVDANTGMILSLEDEMSGTLEELRTLMFGSGPGPNC